MPFDDILASAQSVFDAEFGRAYRLDPMAKGDPNARPGPDPTRVPVNLAGIPSGVHSRGAGENGPTQFNTGRAGHTTARLQVNVYGAALPYRPREGDRLVDLVAGERFTIAEVRSEGDGRIALDVNLISQG